MLVPPRNDLEYSRQRLINILSSSRLRFNPYSVSDKRLIEIVRASGWGDEFDITQAVIMTFTRLRNTNNWKKFDGIYATIGNSTDEVFIPSNTFIFGVTANDTLRRERSIIGKTPIRTEIDVAKLTGKTVFVSRVIRGVNIFGSNKVSYRMHRLKDNLEKDAKIIREAMCDAKIEMLERIINYPQCPDYLSCRKDFFDYTSHINKAIDVIRKFPELY